MAVGEREQAHSPPAEAEIDKATVWNRGLKRLEPLVMK